jgi:hypothetical protein
MKCKKARYNYLLYSYNELNEKETRDFEIHIKNCKKCSRSLEELQKTRGLTSSLSLPDSPSLEIPAYSPEKHHQRRGTILRMPFRLAAACVLPALIAFVLLLSTRNRISEKMYSENGFVSQIYSIEEQISRHNDIFASQHNPKNKLSDLESVLEISVNGMWYHTMNSFDHRMEELEEEMDCIAVGINEV